MFNEPLAEYLSFPTIICGKTRPNNKERFHKVHTSEIFKWELCAVDTRVIPHFLYIFGKSKHLQVKHVIEKMSLVM